MSDSVYIKFRKEVRKCILFEGVYKAKQGSDQLKFMINIVSKGERNGLG